MKKRITKKIIYKIVTIALLVVGILLFNQYAADSETLEYIAKAFGYPGVLLLAALSGFNIALPIPIIAFLPFFLEVGMDKTTVILTISIGMTIGDIVGYLIGRTGRELWEQSPSKTLTKIKNIKKRYPKSLYAILALYAAFAPAPNELIVIPMAMMGYRLRYMIWPLLLGNTIFNILVGFGITTIFALF